MSETSSTVDDNLSQSVLEQVDAVCDRFEDAWLAGQRPCIEEYLAEVADERVRQALVKELNALDIYHRQKHAAAPERYRLGEQIGIGGMGEVRRGRDLRLNRELAIKVLREDHQGQSHLQRRFLEEARIGGRLQHPGIVPVHDLGELSDGRPFFTMKLVEGRTLATLLDEAWDATSLDLDVPAEPSHHLPRLLSIFEQICQTLAYAHAQGVIHRDLKPANVMVGAFGEVQVMDWGLAKVLRCSRMDDAASLGETVVYSPVEEDTSWQMRTQPGQAMGTYAYMPPEQASGEVERMGEQSDVFGLGGILCEILIGQPPFTGQDSSDIFAKAKACDHAEALARLDTCGADVELLQLAKACLAAKPEDRPRNAGAVAEAVKAYSVGVQVRLWAAERERAVAQARAEEARKTVAAERRTRRRIIRATLALLLLVVGAGSGAWWQRWKLEQGDKARTNPPSAGAEMAFQTPPPVEVQPVVQPNNPPQIAKADSPPPVPTVKVWPAHPERWTAEGRERVKRATVFLRVKMPDGTTSMGTGFFGCKEARNIVLTNAHVVGMLAPESMRPLSIEVIVNNGEANEWKTTARVLGIDRASDLAVLDIGTPPQLLPEPLAVKSAGLNQLDEVYVFGFPLGEQLSKEITIRRASVSALRRKNGNLERVQVNGGIDPGNSGGPVLDKSGVVVGVAVCGIEGRQINFAIPGERVQSILEGRIGELAIHQPYFLPGNKVAVPVTAEMIDPRNLVKQVGLEVWTGDKPANAKASTRPETTRQPAAQAGDSARLYFTLKYQAPEGKADIVLPELPPGKVYWQQAKWVNAKSEAYWGAASPMNLPSQPVNRLPANLVLHYNQGSKRTLALKIENILKVSGSDDDSEAFRIRTTAEFTETVASTGRSGTVLSLRYRHPPHREVVLPYGETHSNKRDEQFVHDMPLLVTTHVQLDRLGNILEQAIDPRPLAMIDPQQAKSIQYFHERIQQALESLAVSLPPGGTVNPLDSWRAERVLPIDTPGKTELGKIDVTFTYLGRRKRDGREEAVINMDGRVRGKSDGISGKATGQILVDLNSGQTILAEMTVKLQLEALLSEDGKLRPIRVLAAMKFRIQRKL